MCRLFARMALSGLPRGGGDGDAIRMGILHIMRENGIREGHRPVSARAWCPDPASSVRYSVCFCEAARKHIHWSSSWDVALRILLTAETSTTQPPANVMTGGRASS